MLNMKGRQANAFYEFIQGYFYFCIASDPPIVEYHELQYFTSEEELYKYLFREYSGTDGDKIPQYTITDLKKGFHIIKIIAWELENQKFKYVYSTMTISRK